MDKIMKTCQICNKEFTPKTHSKKYCSKECKTEAANKLRRVESKTPEQIESLRAKKREYKYKNIEKVIENKRNWKKNNRDKVQNSMYREKGYLLNGVQFTYNDYLNLLSIQNNKCVGCNVDFSMLNPKHIHVDHNHLTGNVRGILCSCCNLALGNARDNVQTLLSLVKYLEANK